MNAETVLVTGGAGFIGSHVCDRLLGLGFNVVCMDNFCGNYDPLIKRRNIENALKNPRFTLVEGDVSDQAFVENIFSRCDYTRGYCRCSRPGPDSSGRVDYARGDYACYLSTRAGFDAVVHLAALAGVRSSLLAPLDYVDADIKGTVSILEACKKFGSMKLIFASSSSVYGVSAGPSSEEDAPGVLCSPYAAAKYSGELFCRTYSNICGIRVVCLRFFTVYGPRQRPDMAVRKFAEAIDEGREITVYGDGTSSRDYTYIDDIVDGIILSLNLNRAFEAINLGNSATINILELIKLIEITMKKTAKVKFVEKQPGDVPSTCADIGKATVLLGYKPKVKLEEGIRRFVEWYGSNRG